MKFLNHLSVFIIALLVSFTFGCGDNSKKAIDFGKFENGTYSNGFFNLKVSIPDPWAVMDDETRIALMQKSKQFVAGDDKNLKAAIDAADLQSLNLLSASEKPIGTPVATNPSFIILAESIKHAPGVVKGSDYHAHTKKIMENSQLDVSFPTAIYEKTVGGKTFEVMEMEMHLR